MVSTTSASPTVDSSKCSRVILQIQVFAKVYENNVESGQQQHTEEETGFDVFSESQ